EERGKLREDRLEGDFMFFCYVRTSGGSVISGEVGSRDASPSTWREFYAAKADGTPAEVSSGDIRAMVHPNLASVYIPCTPPGKKPGEA
ncbi:hypothetical protein, partial [Streptomyces sp. NRRL S-118]|uniref:hypothetical protein n=1 Tax=Streptomyces sp. NRRL S-118 TaxID=1463881 RepID=UPI0004C9BA9E